MRKLAEPAPDTTGDLEIQRKITENSVPSARSDQFVDWQSKNQGGNYDQFRQQYLANPDNQYTGQTDGKMYQAPTQFTGDIDHDIGAEMRRLQASSPSAVYEGPQGIDALKRTATRNVFDANQNMSYDDLTSANSDAYTNKDTGGATTGTNALADRMRFVQNTGPEQFEWLSPTTYGVPRFARNLFNPNEWSANDFNTADTTATIATGLLGGGAAPIYQAAKGLGNIYNTYQNGGYNGPDGFRFGRLGMDALRGVANTTLSSIGASQGGGLGGNVFKGMDNFSTGLVKGTANHILRPGVNMLGRGLDYAGRVFRPGLANAGNTFVNTARNMPRAMGYFAKAPSVLPNTSNAFSYAKRRFGDSAANSAQRWSSAPAYDALGSWINYAGTNTGRFVSNHLAPSITNIGQGITRMTPTFTRYVPQAAKNLARQGLNTGATAAENFLGNNIFNVAEDRAANYAIHRTKDETLGQAPAGPTNMQLTQNMRRPTQQPLAFNSRPMPQQFNRGRI